MNILTPVDPGPPPGGVVDDHYVRVPIKAAIPPAPRAEEFSDGYEEVKADRAADHDSGLRREENNRRSSYGTLPCPADARLPLPRRPPNPTRKLFEKALFRILRCDPRS